jgi:protoporphyrinogen IX oxidase
MNAALGWALVVHILGVVAWIGGLLAASRAFGSQLKDPTADGKAALTRLGRKLLRGLAHPGAALAVLAGAALLVIEPAYLQQGWLHAKLGLVILLIAVDVWFTFRVSAFEAGRGKLDAGDVRLAHALTWLLFLAIAIVVIIKP